LLTAEESHEASNGSYNSISYIEHELGAQQGAGSAGHGLAYENGRCTSILGMKGPKFHRVK